MSNARVSIVFAEFSKLLAGSVQQTGTDFTQTGSPTPSIITSTILFFSYNIVNYKV